MTTPHAESGLDAHFAPGNRALLVAMGRRFMVAVLHADAGRVRVSFPMRDFPFEGMRVDLEFHDDHGFAHCETEVLECSGEPGAGLVLRRPAASMWQQHRGAWRVPVDLPVAYKDHVHPRRVDARIVNLSVGGAMLHTGVGAEAGDNIDVDLRLPDAEPLHLLGQVVHSAPLPDASGQWQVGVRFISPDPVDRKTISQYVWGQLRAQSSV